MFSAPPPPVNTGKGVRATGKNDVSQFQTLMLPLLKAMGDGHEMTTIQMRDAVAADLGMGATALSQPLPDGTQNDFDNRLGWAISFLVTAGLLERPRRATYVISETGKQLLLSAPIEIDADFLRPYGEISQLYDSPRGKYISLPPEEGNGGELTPEEQIEIDSSQIQRQLSNEVIEKIKSLRPEDHKRLMIYLLESMTSSRQKA